MDIFDKLKKVFSSGIIVRDIDTGTIKVIDHNRTQAYSKQNKTISKLLKNSQIQSSLSQNYSLNRLALYRDYDMMDSDALLSSALDIYVFQSLTKDQYGDILKITSKNEQISRVLYQLFYQRLNCQFNFNVWFRNFVKYGDFFLALKLDNQHGIIGCQPISPYDIERVQDQNGTSQNYSFKLTSNNSGIIQNHNIAHFRLLVDTNFLPYGRSVLQPVRRVWKNLTLMMDAMMIQRIMRAPQRRVFKIDVGDLPNQQVGPFMKDVIDKMKKVPYKDQQTGQINLKYNIQNLLQDFFIPVRGKQDGSSIQTLSGMQNSMVQDIEFIKDYLHMGLKIPKAFLANSQGMSNKSTLSGQDIILGRYIQTFQNIFVNQLYRVALIHLFILGYTELQDIDFKLELNNPSNVKQMQQMQLWSQKIQLGVKMQESGHFDMNFIYNNVYKISGDQAKKMLKRKKTDAKYSAMIQKILQGSFQQSMDQQEESDNVETKPSQEYMETPSLSEQSDQMDQQENPLDNNNFRGKSPLHLDK